MSLEFNRIKLKSDHLTSEIEDKKKVIHNLQNDLSKMTMYATDLQMYVGMQYLEKSVSKEVGYLNKLQRKGQLDEIRLESKLSSDLKCLTNNIKSFGTAVAHSSPCTLQFNTSGEYQVHLSVPPLLTIDNINPKLKTTLKIPIRFDKINIYGCQVLPDGRNVILDVTSKSLLLFSKDGEFTENLQKFEDEPNDICYIKGNLIAVTIHQKNKILLIDIVNKNITKTIKVADTCYGIDSNGEALVVNLDSSPMKLLIMDFDGNALSVISVPGQYTIHTALFKNNILCTDWKDNLVYCYTNKGSLLWTYNQEDICKPFGITVDKHGFIYVTCKGNDKIAVLSEDGKTSRTIISKDLDVVCPSAINIEKSSCTLLVTNQCNGNAFVFEI